MTDRPGREGEPAAPAPSGPPPAAAGQAPDAGRGAAARDQAAAMRLGMTLQLAHRARHCEANELPFIITNETRQLFPYRQAAFWMTERGRPKLKMLSGLALPDLRSPYAVWLGRFSALLLARAGRFRPGHDDGGIQSLSLPAMAGEEGAPGWLADWGEWLPPVALFIPLRGPGGWLAGVLCLFRDAEFTEGERRLAVHLAESYGDILGGRLLRPRRRSGVNWWRAAGILVIIAIAAAMFMPRPQTALAQAEVAARRPAIVRAGVEGVVERILVEPNQRVTRGTPLFRLEDTQLRTRLTVAHKAEEMARVELRQLRQAAIDDPKSKARLPLAQGRVDQLVAEAEYVKTLLERVTAASPMDGVALVENPDDWRGRPVGLGQKILMVADPGDVMLEIHLPVAEAMPAEVGDELWFFPNVSPGSPVRARVVNVSYRAVDTPGVGMAFRLRAEFVDSSPPLLGMRGMARLAGKPSPLGLIILRRPIMAVRLWLGW